MIEVVTVSNPSPISPVQAHRVNFIDEGECIVAMCNVADLFNWADCAEHGVHRLKHHNLGPVNVVLLQTSLEVLRVVMAIHLLGSAAVPDALNQGVVVPFVREEDQVLDVLAQSGESGLVGHIAGGEDEGCLLAVDASEGLLQTAVLVAGA